MSRKLIGLWALVVALALLGIGTINNQLKLNAANARLAAQAQAGQKALNRQCKLVPIGKKLYMDALERDVISPADYDLVISSAAQACGTTRP